jgi:hypothetical protein
MARSRVLPPLVLATIVAAVALAGCAGGDGGTKGMDPVPDAAQGTATLSGTVLDEENLPIASATVYLQEPDLEATTDVDGRYSFEGLAAGTVTMEVHKMGYRPLPQRVTLQEGVINEVDVVLAIIPVLVPHHETIPFDGRFECSYAALDMFWQGCPGQDTLFPESTNLFFFNKSAGAVDVVSELVWQSTSSATGQNLDFSVISAEREGCQWYANAFGPSPVVIRIRVGEQFTNPESPYPVGTCGDPVIDDVDKTLGVLILASPTYVGGMATVGVTLQQPYSGYNTIFYHEEAPEGFSALPDT